MQSCHKPDVQNHIDEGRNGQENQRHHRVSHGPEKEGKEVIQKDKQNSHKHRCHILPGHVHQFRRGLQQLQNRLHPRVENQVQPNRDRQNKPEGQPDIPFQLFFVSGAVIRGEECAAAHAKTDDDGGQKHHQGIGRPHRRQGIGADAFAHHQGVHQIVDLLQQVSCDHRQRKPKQLLKNRPLGQILFFQRDTSGCFLSMLYRKTGKLQEANWKFSSSFPGALCHTFAPGFLGKLGRHRKCYEFYS